MSDKPLKSTKLKFKIEFNHVNGTWLFGRYWWTVRGDDFNTYGYGWARTIKSAQKKVQKVLAKQQSKPSVYTVEEGEL